MASLRDAARLVLCDAQDGVSWIAVWKNGRSWNAETMPGVEYEERARVCGITARPERWTVEPDDAQRLTEIYKDDNRAILVNGYYKNLGDLETMTLDSLCDGIRFQYGFGNIGEIPEVLARAGYNVKF